MSKEHIQDERSDNAHKNHQTKRRVEGEVVSPNYEISRQSTYAQSAQEQQQTPESNHEQT
jgi:hypothetical protein